MHWIYTLFSPQSAPSLPSGASIHIKFTTYSYSYSYSHTYAFTHIRIRMHFAGSEFLILFYFICIGDSLPLATSLSLPLSLFLARSSHLFLFATTYSASCWNVASTKFASPSHSLHLSFVACVLHFLWLHLHMPSYVCVWVSVWRVVFTCECPCLPMAMCE